MINALLDDLYKFFIISFVDVLSRFHFSINVAADLVAYPFNNWQYDVLKQISLNRFVI